MSRAVEGRGIRLAMSLQNGMSVTCIHVDELREKECRVVLERVGEDTTTDQRGETGSEPVPADPAMGRAGEEEEGNTPGPACSGLRRSARSRSSSTASVVSLSSNASESDATRRRRNRRKQAYDVNRRAAAATRGKMKDCSVVLIQTGSEEAEGERGPSTSEDRSRKRKMAVDDGTLEPTDHDCDGTRGKRGRPPSTAEYIGLAVAQEEYNQKLRETMDLENERAVRSLSAGQVFSKMERDLERAVDELREAPTADVANLGRGSMAEVLKVANISRNLKGGLVKALKQAAVVGSAATEVLRTRADGTTGESDCSDTTRQLKALKRELESTRREAQQAREEATTAKKEAESLRAKLEKMEGRREGRRQRRRTYVRDSSSSSSPSPLSRPESRECPRTP